jgi:hypothetical protein
MSDDRRDPESNTGTDDYTGTPRWVYAFAGVALVLLVAFVILHLTGHGFRGHGR